MRSNGESALAYFVDSVKDDTLYLLDESENSLSAEFLPQNNICDIIINILVPVVRNTKI